jgi:CheY-like chemotaxis protein
MKILIIEDSDYKIQNLQSLLNALGLGSELQVAKSFQTGKRALKEFRPDLLLLDMTLPTSERPDGQLEGRTRIFGGREILAEMEFLQIKSKVIIVTQFDHFGEPPNSLDLKSLFQQLNDRFPDLFLGGVYYSNVDSSWQANLRKLLKTHNLAK